MRTHSHLQPQYVHDPYDNNVNKHNPSTPPTPTDPSPTANPDQSTSLLPLNTHNLYHDLALKLAWLLDDMHSLAYYLKLIDRWKQGQLCPGVDRQSVAIILLEKAQELNRLRYPKGYIRRPGAVFASWVKLL